MATSTFDRNITLTDPASVKKFYRILNAEAPKKPISQRPYSESNRKKSEELLKLYLSRSEH